MPTLKLNKDDLVQQITTTGPTDFKVISGSLWFSTDTFDEDTNMGFPMWAKDTFFVASGKTVNFRTERQCVLQYEVLT